MDRCDKNIISRSGWSMRTIPPTRKDGMHSDVAAFSRSFLQNSWRMPHRHAHGRHPHFCPPARTQAKFGSPTLVLALCFYWACAVVTYGISVPSGLFVPCILMVRLESPCSSSCCSQVPWDQVEPKAPPTPTYSGSFNGLDPPPRVQCSPPCCGTSVFVQGAAMGRLMANLLHANHVSQASRPSKNSAAACT